MEKIDIWLVYGNNHFNPCCGKVIYLSKEDLIEMNTCYEETEERGKVK